MDRHKIKPAEAGFVLEVKGGIMTRESGLHAISKLLLGMASNISSISDAFSNWLALGTGAILSLLISNIDKLATYLDIQLIKRAAYLYCATLIMVAAQKLISTWVLSAKSGGSVAEKYVQEIVESGLGFKEYVNQSLAASIPPNKWILEPVLKKMEEKFEEGDMTWSSRFFTKAAQVQGLIVLVQAAMSIYIVWLISSAIK